MSKIPLFTADGRISTKVKRSEDCRRNFNSAPETYKSNTTKDELCFEYIQSFKEQFQSLYPKRKLPYMLAENEYGVMKFVCTTLRPTQLSFHELYDMYECASFLAGYIVYEPLEPHMEPPKVLFSPSETLNSHTGDSFDIAMVLCSFLLGAGYDAYVVYGTSPKYITLKDQRALQCPLLPSSSIETTNGKAKAEDKVASAMPAVVNEVNLNSSGVDKHVYNIPDKSIKDSRFIATQEEEKRNAGKDDFVLWMPNNNDSETSNENIRNQSCHAFVMVKAGKKELKETVFLEPATGRPYNSQNVPLNGIIAVWNHQNYWVNMQMNVKTSQMTFDLWDGKNWEYLFVKEHRKGEEVNEDGDDLDVNGEDEEKGEGETPAGHEISRSFDVPPTWVDVLHMDRPRFTLRYPPSGKRCIQYDRARAYFFAHGVHKQAMSMRIIQYLDVERTIVKEIHEWFANRADKLYKRIRYLLNENRCVDFYHPGSLGGVKTWTEYPGRQIDVEFNVDSRLDRLYRREETVGKQITEYFEGRTDNLIYRSVDITADKASAGARHFAMSGGTLAPEIFVLKMVQKFTKPENSVGGKKSEAVAMRMFSIREGKLTSYYHFAESKVTGLIRTFLHTRGPSIPVMSDQALAQELGLEEDPEELQDAASHERECFAAVKGSIQQLDLVVQNRQEVEEDVKIERSVFDIALDQCYGMDIPEKSKKAEPVASETQQMSASISSVAEDATAVSDYLTPFLRSVKDISSISKEEALEVRQVCLDACKARLVERANIIQARLNDENAKLGRKQEQFQRSQREGDMSTEDYEKYCTEAMFRIQILEQRLVTHEETALKKFLELDVRLAADPRLKVLRTSER